MAQGRRRRTAGAAEGDAKKVTRRVVLERVSVMVLPPDVSEDVVKQLAGIVSSELTGDVPVREAWVERGEFAGGRAVVAIEAYVKPGTPEQKTGVFRAPPLSNWRGAQRYVQPSLTPVKREALD